MILLQLIIGGFLMVSLGIIGTYIARIYEEVKGRPRYVVRRRAVTAMTEVTAGPAPRERDAIAMAGDYQARALNPHGRHSASGMRREVA